MIDAQIKSVMFNTVYSNERPSIPEISFEDAYRIYSASWDAGAIDSSALGYLNLYYGDRLMVDGRNKYVPLGTTGPGMYQPGTYGTPGYTDPVTGNVITVTDPIGPVITTDLGTVALWGGIAIIAILMLRK
jgi:hypothetical protein